MKWFSSVLAAVCSSCVLMGVLHMLCPAGTMEKPVKYMLSLAFLLTLVVTVLPALKNAQPAWSVPKVEFDASQELETAAAEYVYAAALRSEGIKFSQITVCTDKTADGGICISKVVVVSDEPSQRIITALGAVAENVKVVVQNE